MSEDLFQLYKKGDQKAFGSLFNLLHRPIYYFTVDLIKDDAEAEDIVSETFTKAWKNRDTIERFVHLKPWLYTTARNACYDYLRRRKTRQKTEAGDDLDTLLDMAQDDSYLEREQVKTELLADVRQYMEELGDTQKTILRLRYLEGLAYEEIAERLGLEITSVNNSRNRAMAILRRKLKIAGSLSTLLIVYFLLYENI